MLTKNFWEPKSLENLPHLGRVESTPASSFFPLLQLSSKCYSASNKADSAFMGTTMTIVQHALSEW